MEKIKLPVAEEYFQVIEKYGRVVFVEWWRMPNGSKEPFLMYTVKPGTESAVILPVTADGYVVAQEEFRYAAKEVLLEIPGGCARNGETPEQAIKRELFEETGYKADIIIPLGPFWIDPASLRFQQQLFLGLGCKKVGQPKCATGEFIRVKKIPLEKWIMMCQDGRISDGKTIIVTMRALPHLK